MSGNNEQPKSLKDVKGPLSLGKTGSRIKGMTMQAESQAKPATPPPPPPPKKEGK